MAMGLLENNYVYYNSYNCLCNRLLGGFGNYPRKSTNRKTNSIHLYVTHFNNLGHLHSLRGKLFMIVLYFITAYAISAITISFLCYKVFVFKTKLIEIIAVNLLHAFFIYSIFLVILSTTGQTICKAI